MEKTRNKAQQNFAKYTIHLNETLHNIVNFYNFTTHNFVKSYYCSNFAAELRTKHNETSRSYR